MLAGIYETGECRDNRITDNTINYYTEKGIRSEGRNTESLNNTAVAGYYAHPSAGPFAKRRAQPRTTPPFTTDRVDAFLELTRR